MIKKIVIVLGFVIYGVGMYIGISKAHTYDIPMKPVETYEEIIELPIIEEEIIEEEEEIIDQKTDIDVIAEVVMSEAGNQEMIGKVAVAMTLLNRIDKTGRAAESIAREAYAYPYHGVVTADCYRAVEIAMENRDLFPDDMMYFRADHYHNFGVPYLQIQDHYFSTKE